MCIKTNSTDRNLTLATEIEAVCILANIRKFIKKKNLTTLFLKCSIQTKIFKFQMIIIIDSVFISYLKKEEEE